MTPYFHTTTLHALAKFWAQKLCEQGKIRYDPHPSKKHFFESFGKPMHKKLEGVDTIARFYAQKMSKMCHIALKTTSWDLRAERLWKIAKPTTNFRTCFLGRIGERFGKSISHTASQNINQIVTIYLQIVRCLVSPLSSEAFVCWKHKSPARPTHCVHALIPILEKQLHRHCAGKKIGWPDCAAGTGHNQAGGCGAYLLRNVFWALLCLSSWQGHAKEQKHQASVPGGYTTVSEVWPVN